MAFEPSRLPVQEAIVFLTIILSFRELGVLKLSHLRTKQETSPKGRKQRVGLLVDVLPIRPDIFCVRTF